MKKAVLTFLSTIFISLASYADIEIIMPENSGVKSIEVEKGSIKDIANQKRGDASVVERYAVPINNREGQIGPLSDTPSQYTIFLSDEKKLIIYTSGDENIIIDVEKLNPISYRVTGSPLMTDINDMNNASGLILEQYREESSQSNPDISKLEALEEEYYKVYKNYIVNNPDKPAAAYALLNLEGEDFLNNYDSLKKNSGESILMPFVEIQKLNVEKQVAFERRMKALQTGTVTAPDFTFKDKDGKDISLTDFRGKWVIVDFWGSWCRWCIKGFPSLKEAYNKYKSRLEIIGIACNDPRDAWEIAIKKYELPWVNLYNPVEGGGPLLEEYAVRGFPTKVIIDPEGKIRNITSGDNPAFYDKLSELLNEVN